MRFLAASTFLLPTLVSAISHPATSATSSSASSVPESVATEPSPTPAADDWVAIQTILPTNTLSSLPTASPLDHLELREIVNAAPVAQATDPTQVSPVTTLTEWQQVNGVAQQVQVVYSQAFSSVPDQGPAPLAGSIGLGTIVGKIGVVKTAVKARSVEATLAARSDNGSGKVTSASSALALLVAIAVMVLA